MSIEPDSTYWRKKLSAYLHDPPEKALDVKQHVQLAGLLERSLLISQDEQFEKGADFAAAAADRIPFPDHRHMKANFGDGTNSFLHPLSAGVSYPHKKLKGGVSAAHEVSSTTAPVLTEKNDRAEFIARWRFWKEWAAEHNPDLAFLPADTRIPDHTIWNHLSLTSAFQGCMERDKNGQAGLLMFSIGPVQAFIAASRNLRDLWSGSYLLSFLASKALGIIANELGPDHVIFPNLLGQPLIDLALKKAVYDQAYTKLGPDADPMSSNMYTTPLSRARLTLPSLPNRFLALVPADQSERIAGKCRDVLRQTLREIGESVLDWLQRKIPGLEARSRDYYPDRVHAQLKGMLETQWYALPIPQTLKEAEGIALKFLPRKRGEQPPAYASVENIAKMWESIPAGHQTTYGMKHAATAWPLLYALCSWGLDATKQCRTFDAWNDASAWSYGTDQNKDSLNGKEELVLRASPEVIKLIEKASRVNRHLLKEGDILGASTLIKRFWHDAYLKDELDSHFPGDCLDFSMPDLSELARGEPFAKGDSTRESGYYAVIALDGDQIGKWLSGEKAPHIGSRLAPDAVKYFESEMAAKTEDFDVKTFFAGARPLSPSYHLQFSEALGNFSLFTTRLIVEAHNGRLIYSGGDDVLAILPAQKALACARYLRAGFRGDNKTLAELRGVWLKDERYDEVQIFDGEAPEGFIRLHEDLRKAFSLDKQDDFTAGPVSYYAVVPGPAATVSSGIAIGHVKSPLQDLVRAAQKAEKRAKADRAKGGLGRSADAISIFKRSGETIEWGLRWNEEGRSAAFDFLQRLIIDRKASSLSARFPYATVAVLEAYTVRRSSLNQDRNVDSAFVSMAQEIVWKDITEILSRQRYPKDCVGSLRELFDAYWNQVTVCGASASEAIRDLVGLMQTIAWLDKGEKGDE